MSYGSALKRLTESHGVAEATRVFGEALASGKTDPRAVRLGDLAETFLGRSASEQVRKLRHIKEGATHLLEASEAIDASAFSNITGQLLVTEIKKKYDSPEFIGDKLVRTIPNPGGNLQTHKIPYLSDVADVGSKLESLQQYPQTRFAESWVTMPAPERFGLICAVSIEMIVSDLTGQAQDSAASIGRAMRYQREQSILKTVLGLNNNYSWNGNTINTYMPTAGVGNYANKLLNETVSNYNQINDAELLFWRQVDPITGRLIYARPTAILCMPSKRYDVKRILNATEVRDGTTGVHDVTGNPLDQNYPVLTSPIAEALLLASGLTSAQVRERVYYGDFQKAFFWREVTPFQTVNAPANNPMEFNQDIALAVKCSYWGVAGVYDPRFAVLSCNEAS